MTADAPVTTLKRRIGPALLIFYGVGVMVGAGIYVLVGEVAGIAGSFAPLSFVIAGLIALPSALSYAELSTRYPEAAGEVAYVSSAFNLPSFGVLTGLAIVFAGTVSAAAVLRGGAGYLGALLPVDTNILIAGAGVVLIVIAILGIVESLGFAAILTVVEVTGLALVIWAGFSVEPVDTVAEPVIGFAAIGAGAALAFFAFIGFEDIVNLAEETKRPERTLPLAIIASLGIATLLYVAVSWAAVRSVGPQALEASTQPLALVWARAGGSGSLLAAIAVAAAMNGVLAQVVMAARVLFGIGRRNPGFSVLAVAHPRFGTPMRATLVVGVTVVVAALLFPVGDLARATTMVLLVVFFIVNLALIRLKRGGTTAAFTVPTWVPYIGAILSGLALIWSIGGLG